MKEGIFDKVPNFIEPFVIFSLFFPVFLWRNDWAYPLARCLVKNFIGIVATVSEQMMGIKTINQGSRLLAICCCTLCNNSPERHTMRIHGQMQFCVEPPFVRLMS